MKRFGTVFATLFAAGALMGVSAFAGQDDTGPQPNDNTVTQDSPQQNDYTGGRIQWNEPLSSPEDPWRQYGGTNVQGPASQPDNPLMNQNIQDLQDLIDQLDTNPPLA
jgi:hypothetical protein